jgi:hypothetical protein
MPAKTADRVAHCAKFRPGDVRDPHEATRLALRTLSRRHQDLSEEMADLRPYKAPRRADQGGEPCAARGQGCGR